MTNQTTDRPGGDLLRSVTFGELAARQMSPRGYLLDPWLREQESVLVWAAAGVGKTMFTLSLALAVAGGGTVLDWTAPRPRRVLIIDGEMPEDDLRSRLVGLADTVEGIDLEQAYGNLRILARHGQSPDAKFPDFGDEAQHDAILDRIRRYEVDLVILDNLSTLAAVEDENSAAATQVVVKFLARLKQARIGVVVVHHAGKAGNTYRGSTMLATTFEAIIGLKRDKGQDVIDISGTTRFDMEWTKYRGLRDARVRNMSATLEKTEAGLRWAAQVGEDEVLEAISALVRSGRYATQMDVRNALPEHLWPTKGAPPAKSWVSKKFTLADAKKVITRHEVERFFKAASDGVVAPDVDTDDDI